jgi:hypothetical protein
MSTAVALKYQILNTATRQPVSSFTLDALYIAGISTVTHSDFLHVLYDLGASPPAINQASVRIASNGSTNAVDLYKSSDGTTWTLVANNISQSSTSPLTTTTIQYWCFVFRTNSLVNPFTATDARLYESGLVPVSPPVFTTPAVHRNRQQVVLF